MRCRWFARLLPLLLSLGLLIAVVVGARASGETGATKETANVRSSSPLLFVHASEEITQQVYLPLIARQRPPFAVRVNVGGPAYTTTQDIFYLADQPYAPGNAWGYLSPGQEVVWTNASAHPMGGTKEKYLLARAREGFGAYRFDLPNGEYLVTLQFAELDRHAPGQRVFDVMIESQPVLTDFDIYGEANLWYGIDTRFTTAVTDGQLDVVFSPTVSAPLLNAIQVTNRWEHLPVLPPPDDVQAVSSYNRILVDWKDDNDTPLKGYRVYRTTHISGSLQSITSNLRLVPYYLDDDVVPGQVYSYTVRAINLDDQEGKASPVLTAAVRPLTSTQLPIYELSIELLDLAILNADPWTDEYVPSIFSFEDASYTVEVRYRGFVTSREAPKKSWKVRWPDGKLFQGQKRLNLMAEFNAAGHINDKFCFDLFQKMGVDGPQATFIHLRLNDEYLGLFTQVEQVDEYFLLRTGQPLGSSIYKVEPIGDFRLHDNPADYANIYQKQTNEGSGYGKLIAFLEVINNTPDDQFPQAIAQVLEVGAYLDYYATVVLVANTDVAVKDFFLIHNPETERWQVLPWDNGSTLWQSTMPIDYGTPANMLLTRVLGVPEFRLYYTRRLIEAMDNEFSPAQIAVTLESYRDQIGQDGELDIWHRYWWQRSFELSLTNFVQKRSVYLQSVVYSYTEGLTLPLALELSPLGDQLALHNDGLLDWDVGGMTVLVDQPKSGEWVLPAGTVIPANTSLALWDAYATTANLMAGIEELSGVNRVDLLDKSAHGSRLVSQWVRRSGWRNLE